MGRFLHLTSTVRSCRMNRVIIALLWVAGLVSGSVICLLSDSLDISGNIDSYFDNLTFGALFCTRIFPLLLTILIILRSELWMLAPVIFFKAFLFSFAVIILVKSAGEAAWLIAAFLAFSDFLSLPFLWYFWQSSILCKDFSILRSGLAASIAVFAVCFFDCYYLAPFAVRLF